MLSDDDLKYHIRAARTQSGYSGDTADVLWPSSVRNAARVVVDVNKLIGGGFVPNRLRGKLPRASSICAAPLALMPSPTVRQPRADACWLVAVGVKDGDCQVMCEIGDELVPADKDFVGSKKGVFD